MSGVAESEADELDAYQVVRFREARAVGLTRVEADRFARGDTPLHTLWKLRDSACAPALIAQIVT